MGTPESIQLERFGGYNRQLGNWQFVGWLASELPTNHSEIAHPDPLL
jgi:hypothetical protein